MYTLSHRVPFPGDCPLPFIRCLCMVVCLSASSANADPSLAFISFLRAGYQEIIAHDAAGNIYVGGNVTTNAIPTTPGAFQTIYNGGTCQRGLSPGGPCSDVFVAKWDPTGMRLLWATYLGGTGDDFLHGMVVDSAGNVYLTGATSSTDFPVTPGAFQARYNTSNPGSGYYVLGDAFIAKLSSSGNALVFATYLGGTSSNSASGIAVDSSGNIYVSGATYSTDFPVTAEAYQRVNHASSPTTEGYSAFVTKLNPTGTSLIYSTYLGGSVGDDAVSLAVDAAGVAYVAGSTHSPDFPVTTTALKGGIFLARLNTSGTSLLSSTTFGGSGPQDLYAMAVDRSGQVYLAGSTTATDFPATPDALQTSLSPGACGVTSQGPLYCPDGFVARFDASGVSLGYATYLGGSFGAVIESIAVDSQGFVYVAGGAVSVDFPVTADAFQPCSRSAGIAPSAFVARFKPGSPLAYSTYLGGAGGAEISSIFVDDMGHIYLGGTANETGVPDFPPAPVPLLELGATDSGGTFLGMIDLSIAAPPSRISCIVNGADKRGNYISPGEIVEIRGKGLGPPQQTNGQLTKYGTLGTSLAGVQVFFSGIAAPLISVQAERIVAIVPGSFPLPSQVQVQVQSASSITPGFPAVLKAATPAVFTQDGSGHGPAAVLNQDGTVNSLTNPAAKGSVIAIFCTGLGGLGADGTINSGGVPAPGGKVGVSIGGYSGDVLFDGGAPGQVYGVYQVNVRVPQQARSGAADQVYLYMDNANFYGASFALPVTTIFVQ